jgi:hypothetical protein
MLCRYFDSVLIRSAIGVCRLGRKIKVLEYCFMSIVLFCILTTFNVMLRYIDHVMELRLGARAKSRDCRSLADRRCQVLGRSVSSVLNIANSIDESHLTYLPRTIPGLPTWWRRRFRDVVSPWPRVDGARAAPKARLSVFLNPLDHPGYSTSNRKHARRQRWCLDEYRG